MYLQCRKSNSSGRHFDIWRGASSGLHVKSRGVRAHHHHISVTLAPTITDVAVIFSVTVPPPLMVPTIQRMQFPRRP